LRHPRTLSSFEFIFSLQRSLPPSHSAPRSCAHPSPPPFFAILAVANFSFLFAGDNSPPYDFPLVLTPSPLPMVFAELTPAFSPPYFRFCERAPEYHWFATQPPRRFFILPIPSMLFKSSSFFIPNPFSLLAYLPCPWPANYKISALLRVFCFLSLFIVFYFFPPLPFSVNFLPPSPLCKLRLPRGPCSGALLFF